MQKEQPAFDVLTPSQSGILLQGMLGSLLYFEGDTSLVVAGFNRAKLKCLNNSKKGTCTKASLRAGQKRESYFILIR